MLVPIWRVNGAFPIPGFIVFCLMESRLKTTLNLPPIEPRPPIPPKVYKNLYSYFDHSLVTSTRKAAQSRSAKSTPQKSLPQRQTPQKSQSLKSFQPQSNRTPKKGLRYASKKDNDERIPVWLAPVTRLLCRELGTPKAFPHVLAGVETILCLPSEKAGEAKNMEGKLPALVSAIWFFVVVRMRGKENQGKENLARKKLVREVLASARDDDAILNKIGREDEAWKGWETIEEREVNSWRKEIVAKGWKEMDWFLGIEEGCGVGDEDEADTAMLDEDPEKEEGDVAKKQGYEDVGRAKGLGTMMLDKYDYLSEVKRREYAEWKRMVYQKMDELTAEGVLDDDGSDVDVDMVEG